MKLRNVFRLKIFHGNIDRAGKPGERTLNVKKIDYMVISRRDCLTFELCIGDIKIKLSHKFNYLVSIVKGNRKWDTEIRRRVRIAKDDFKYKKSTKNCVRNKEDKTELLYNI